MTISPEVGVSRQRRPFAHELRDTDLQLRPRSAVDLSAAGRRGPSGRHAPILERPLFEFVQAKLAVQTVARRCRLRGSPALLAGRLFDDHGHRMSPGHTNKGGVRYGYYVCQALLQGKLQGAGSIGRVPAAETEALVLTGTPPAPTGERRRAPANLGL